MKKILVGAILLLQIFPFSPSASAHSALISSVPSKGVVLRFLPQEVSLRFNEDLLIIGGKRTNTVSITSAAGARVSYGNVRITGNRIAISMSSKVTSGRFLVAYRVVSADGHPISGKYFFTVK
jgi:methionine-rich copper-binding protein CopC